MSPTDEEEMLDSFITECWEQGCWIPSDVSVHSLTADAQDALFSACEQRAAMHRERFHEVVPTTLPQHGQDPDDDIWLVASQRCDIIKGLRHEPIVTLVRAKKMPSRDAANKTHHSPIFFQVRSSNDGAYSWVADFRQTINVAKFVLSGYESRQCLSTGDDARRSFALALAQKTWRRPVPHEINEAITKPLAEKRKDNEWKRFFARVSEFLVRHDTVLNRYSLYAVSDNPTGVDPDDMERFFDQEVIPHLQANCSILDTEKSQVIAAEAVNLPLIFRSYKLDLDYLSPDPSSANPDY